MTLLEVLVSILIFSLGILGMVALQARAIQYSADAEDRTRASLMATEIVSTMWSQQSASVSSAALAAWQSRVADAAISGLPNGQGSLSTSASGVTTVTVTWRAPARVAADADSSYVTQVVIP